MLPHAFGLCLHVEAMLDTAKEHQPQVVADVIVHGHVVADQVNAQWTITFTDCLLLASGVTYGDFADHVVSEDAA